MICLSVMGNNLFLYSKEKCKPCKWPAQFLVLFAPFLIYLFIFSFMVAQAHALLPVGSSYSSGQRIFMGSGYLAMGTQQQIADLPTNSGIRIANSAKKQRQLRLLRI